MNISKQLPLKLKNLTPPQIDYYKDRHRFIVVTAGRRSRKSLIGGRKVLNDSIEYPDHRYFLSAPTHQQAKNIFWDRFLRDTRLFRKDVSKSELIIKLMNNTELHIFGLDKPERMEGQPWHGGHITEFGNLKADAWDAHIRPALADTGGWAILDGVPEGRNHYYDRALYACDDAIPRTKPYYGAYHECKKDSEWAFYSWFSSDVLAPSEIDHARQQMDEKTFRQEYEGSFESYGGLAYYTFGAHNFSEVIRDFRKPISVGMDFNVNPMTAVLGTIRGDSYHQWGEIWLENSNTYEMVEKLKTYSEYPEDIHIYPDSTGDARESNAAESDIAILKKAKFKIFANPQNPFIIDRVNAVNSILKDHGPKTRYYVNPQECPKTVNDFNRVIRTDDGKLDKKQEEKMIGHISAAVGYLIAYNWPVVESSISYTAR